METDRKRGGVRPASPSARWGALAGRGGRGAQARAECGVRGGNGGGLSVRWGWFFFREAALLQGGGGLFRRFAEGARKKGRTAEKAAGRSAGPGPPGLWAEGCGTGCGASAGLLRQGVGSQGGLKAEKVKCFLAAGVKT